MKKRSGGKKFGRNHSSVNDAALVIADIANACPHVKRVLPGAIRNSHKGCSHSRRVKVHQGEHSLTLQVTANTSHQAFHLIATDHRAVCDWMKGRVEQKGFQFIIM